MMGCHTAIFNINIGVRRHNHESQKIRFLLLELLVALVSILLRVNSQFNVYIVNVYFILFLSVL